MIEIKNKNDIENMKIAGKLAAKTLLYIEPYVNIGVSTEKLNTLCEKFIRENDAIPAPLNYNGFPKSICTSINNVVCHGIPSEKDILKNGDIINIDVTVIKNGYHGDTSETYLVGDTSRKIKKFVKKTRKSMYLGIKTIKPGSRLNDIGIAIEKYISKFDYSIVESYGGHGIGKNFHEEPFVSHCDTGNNEIVLKEGMIFTVEPMINMSKNPNTETSIKDNWTVTTEDNSLSAQFEHTILVTKTGFEILTKI